MLPQKEREESIKGGWGRILGESGNKCLALCVLMYCSSSRRRQPVVACDWQLDELWISFKIGRPAVCVCMCAHLRTCLFHYRAAIHPLLTRGCHSDLVWKSWMSAEQIKKEIKYVHKMFYCTLTHSVFECLLCPQEDITNQGNLFNLSTQFVGLFLKYPRKKCLLFFARKFVQL